MAPGDCARRRSRFFSRNGMTGCLRARFSRKGDAMGFAFLDACRIRLCAIVALGTVAVSANAEAPAPGPNDDGIEPIVVTAQRRSQDVQRVPISIQAFTAKAITDLGIKSSTDLGQVTPNITIALPS